MITPRRIPRLPDISNVRFFVLESLMVCPHPGKQLHSKLRAERDAMSGRRNNAKRRRHTARLFGTGILPQNVLIERDNPPLLRK